MIKKIWILAVGLFCVFPWSAVHAGDFELWTELKYAHAFPDGKLTLRWAAENRFFNDVTKLGVSNSTLGFDYRVFKWLRPGYFQRVEKKWGSPTEIRFMPQVEFLVEAGPLQVEDRQLFEIRVFTNGFFHFRYRQRVRVSHLFPLSPVSFTPYASEEVFVETERTNPVQNRMILGNSFGFAKNKISFDLYYMLQSEKLQGKPGWLPHQILGTSLGFKY